MALRENFFANKIKLNLIERRRNMNYPEKKMRLSELVKMDCGFSKKELRAIYKNRMLNRQFSIACKMTPGVRNSPIMFDTDALEKYWNSKCTGD